MRKKMTENGIVAAQTWQLCKRRSTHAKMEAFYLPSALSLIVIIIITEWRNCLNLVIQRLLLCAWNLCNHLKDLTGQNVMNNWSFSALTHTHTLSDADSFAPHAWSVILYAPFSLSPNPSYIMRWIERLYQKSYGVFYHALCSCSIVEHFSTTNLYTSQYWLRSYAIQFIWNMMDNDWMEWQLTLCAHTVYTNTHHKIKCNRLASKQAIFILRRNIYIRRRDDDYGCHTSAQYTLSYISQNAMSIEASKQKHKCPFQKMTQEQHNNGNKKRHS